MDAKIAEIKQGLDQTGSPGSYQRCFDSHNRMRTLIALSVFLIQGCSGVGWVVGYMGYFLELSGMEGDAVFNTTLGIAGLMVTGCMVSSFLVELLGRRKLVVSGKSDNDFLYVGRGGADKGMLS